MRCEKLNYGTSHSTPNSKMVCVQTIVYQTDLNSQHTGTGSPKSEPNSYILLLNEV